MYTVPDNGLEGENMSFKSVDLCFEIRDLEATPWRILAIIARYSDDHGRSSFPGIATIVTISGVSERHVKRVIKLLEAKGLIKIIENKGGRGHKAIYQFTPPPYAVVAAAKKNLHFTLIKGGGQAPAAHEEEEQENIGELG